MRKDKTSSGDSSMLISTKTRYGLRALIDLIINYKDKPIYLKEIAKRQHIPLRYLENIFLKLKNQGIVKSYKGKGGGFVPEKDTSNITLFDLISLLENKRTLSECITEPLKCDLSKDCKTRELWVKLEKSINEKLESITIDTLI